MGARGHFSRRCAAQIRRLFGTFKGYLLQSNIGPFVIFSEIENSNNESIQQMIRFSRKRKEW